MAKHLEFVSVDVERPTTGPERFRKEKCWRETGDYQERRRWRSHRIRLTCPFSTTSLCRLWWPMSSPTIMRMLTVLSAALCCRHVHDRSQRQADPVPHQRLRGCPVRHRLPCSHPAFRDALLPGGCTYPAIGGTPTKPAPDTFQTVISTPPRWALQNNNDSDLPLIGPADYSYRIPPGELGGIASSREGLASSSWMSSAWALVI